MVLPDAAATAVPSSQILSNSRKTGVSLANEQRDAFETNSRNRGRGPTKVEQSAADGGGPVTRGWPVGRRRRRAAVLNLRPSGGATRARRARSQAQRVRGRRSLRGRPARRARNVGAACASRPARRARVVGAAFARSWAPQVGPRLPRGQPRRARSTPSTWPARGRSTRSGCAVERAAHASRVAAHSNGPRAPRAPHASDKHQLSLIGYASLARMLPDPCLPRRPAISLFRLGR